MNALVRMFPIARPQAGRPRAEDVPWLRRRNRAIYVARHVEGRTVRQIAEDYGLSERQVYGILSRAPRPAPRLHRPEGEMHAYHGDEAPDHCRLI